jgi:integrase/recombinase XerD
VTADLELIPGPRPAAAGDRIRRLVAAWLLGYESQATRRNYGLDLAAWLSFCSDHGIEPLAARRAHVDAWARTVSASGAAQRTVARRLAAVSSWYRYLVAEDLIRSSPTEHVRRPKVADRGETPGLTRNELRRLLAEAKEHGSLRSVALLSLLAHTGLRINEALSRDVEHLAHDRGHRILRLERKGGRGDRTVLTAPVARALDEYLAGRTSGPLFITKAGKRMGSPRPGRWSGGWPSGLRSPGRVRFRRTPCGWRSSPAPGRLESRSKTSRMRPGTPIPGPPAATTAAATPSTGTPRTP